MSIDYDALFETIPDANLITRVDALYKEAQAACERACVNVAGTVEARNYWSAVLHCFQGLEAMKSARGPFDPVHQRWLNEAAQGRLLLDAIAHAGAIAAVASKGYERDHRFYEWPAWPAMPAGAIAPAVVREKQRTIADYLDERPELAERLRVGPDERGALRLYIRGAIDPEIAHLLSYHEPTAIAYVNNLWTCLHDYGPDQGLKPAWGGRTPAIPPAPAPGPVSKAPAAEAA